jgi:hypothetical protein
MVDAHFVAFAVMLIRLRGSDCAQGNNSRGNGENDFLHYKTLKSMLWSYRHSTWRAASTLKHATSRAWRVGTLHEYLCQCNNTSVSAGCSPVKGHISSYFQGENGVNEQEKAGTNEREIRGA